MQTFDLVVLGTGPAGSSVAVKCAEAGWKVALVEAREFGGTCALRGCNPKKVFVRAAELWDWAHRSSGQLISGGDQVRIDWPQLVAFKRTFTDPVPEKSLNKYREVGIEPIAGAAQFTGERTLRAGDHELTGEHILIATGAKPRRLDIPGEDLLTLSDQFMELEQLPRRIVFVGGGYISMEFAHVAVRAGAEVTVIDDQKLPLVGFEPELVERLVERSEAAGIRFELSSSVTLIEQRGDGLRVQWDAGGPTDSADCDLAVHGAGRVPNIEALNLEAGGVAADEKGVRVDETLRSVSNRSVFAAGDAAGSSAPNLTPAANAEAVALIKTLLSGTPTRPRTQIVPQVAFTIPAIAAVGLTEQQAREQDIQFSVKSGDMGGWSTFQKLGESAAAYKLMTDEESGRLIGAHLIGPESAELINVFAVAMAAEVPVDELRRVNFAFPSISAQIASMVR